ncbi:hypothetical protein [Kitasatospora sp. NPDC085879]|nr:hypothetical protein BX265_7332 [Streptomyces sp. TLI_235]
MTNGVTVDDSGIAAFLELKTERTVNTIFDRAARRLARGRAGWRGVTAS